MEQKEGLIFDAKKNLGTAYINPPEPRSYRAEIKTFAYEKKLFSWRPFLLTVASGFLSLAIFGLLFLFWPVLVQEIRYQLIISHQSTAVDKTFPGFPNGDQWAPVNTTFSIVIPKIDAKAPIIANVSLTDETIYQEALKKGVAQAKGTCFPGMSCRMYLFAHSTNSPFLVSQFNAVFYLLRKLEPGDQILVYYYGKKILYEVTGKEIVGSKETKYLTEIGQEEQLILQTCDPPGTTLNRLLVFAKPKLVEYLK